MKNAEAAISSKRGGEGGVKSLRTMEGGQNILGLRGPIWGEGYFCWGWGQWSVPHYMPCQYM